MNSKEFIQGIIEYLKNNLNIPDATFLKDRIKFKKGKYVYSEISFSYSRIFDGVQLNLLIYNSEMGNFFSLNVPPYDKSTNPYDLVFAQASISKAHYFQAPFITSFPHGDTIKLPESENDAKKIYSDVLKHLQENHIPIITAFHSSSKEVLKYLALYPSAFRFKALTAVFIINKNKLSPNDALIQNILMFDQKVLKNDNGLFSKQDMIFLENSFDQKLKQQILQ
ncbi:growth inhibitor PemK [Neisseria dumasiana]|uniref:growth inhibitor PemK n=1 Tax=Neisseria dumasiana TaxID=1931275 RepID=UPI000A18E71D|nr:growth inhibitor PemK [Neisseria dumasiana]OSI13841.1 growth inhibitor PemK [Neisseria dumasiana]